MPGPTQYDTVGSLFVALGAMVVVMFLCRWVFSTSHRDKAAAQRLARQRAAASRRGDYGLLVPVAQVQSRSDAQALRDRLTSAGIRGTVAEGDAPGELAVLVFRQDAVRARDLVS